MNEASKSANSSETALVVTDMISAYDHDDADALSESAKTTVPAVADLIAAARRAQLPVIYVNDNYGRWTSSRQDLIDFALSGQYPHLVEPLLPHESDSFVIKARHTIFYNTPVEYLLRQQGIERLVLAGQVTEQCILYSSLDAYVRHFEVVVAQDAVAHIHAHLADCALEMIELNMEGTICESQELISRFD
jgi:nicotinamidase-related amidase